MSISVALDDLAEHVSQRGPGYLLTTNAESRPHVMHLRWTMDGVELQAGVGRSASANIGAQAAVTLLWPPMEEGGYSLIVDGEAVVNDGPDGAVAVVTAQSAVLHRPA